MADTSDQLADAFVEATNPPEVDEKTGVAMIDGYPANHRLRAEALAADGKAEDPAGHILPDLIANTVERLERERAADDAERKAAPAMSWTRDRLIDEAIRRGFTIADDANKAAILAVIEAAPAAGNEG